MKIFSKCKNLGIVKNCLETNLWRKKEHFAKYVVICEVFLELQSLYNLVDFLKLSMLINASGTLSVLFDEVNMGLGHEKNRYFVRYHLYHFFFWKTVMDDLNEWLEVTLAENTIQKKMATYKKDDRLSHQNSIKVLNFYCNQRSRFIFIHLMLKKSAKSFITEYIPDVRTIIS